MEIEEAIENIKLSKSTVLFGREQTIVNIEAIDTVLNELEKKDKVIDEMAKEIDKEPNPDICKQMEGMECNNREILCTECIKKYYEKKACDNK